MFGRAGIVAVLGLFSVTLPFVSNSGQSNDESNCFNGVGSGRVEACSRLIDEAKLDDRVRGQAYAVRCSEHVTLQKLDLAQRDCAIARYFAPDEPFINYAMFRLRYQEGDTLAAADYMARYLSKTYAEMREKSDRQSLMEEVIRMREAQTRVTRLAQKRLPGMRKSCFATTSDARSAEIISACNLLLNYSAHELDRALAFAVICRHETNMRQFDLAEGNCSRSFEYGMPTAYGHFVRGNLRLALRDFEGALKDYEAAAALKALSSTDAATMAKKFAQAKAGADEINRKKAEEIRVEKEKAERETATREQAKRSNKNHQQVPDELGSPDTAYDDRRCATAGESLHRVRACLARELRKSPSDPDLMIRLANIHSEAGNHAEAVKIWSKLIAAFPNLVEFRQARCHEWILWGRQRQAAQHNCSTVIGQGAAE